MDNRNIIDFYKEWETAAIKADLDEKRHDFSVLVSNQIRDFNLGTVIRNANAFLAKDVIICGRKQWDRRGAVGVHHYENLRHVRYIEEFDPGDRPLVGIDNIPGAVPIDTFSWPKDAVMAFGEEKVGLPDEIIKLCSAVVYIRQYGSVRSLNVGTASGLAMYSYCLQHVNQGDIP